MKHIIQNIVFSLLIVGVLIGCAGSHISINAQIPKGQDISIEIETNKSAE